ncbi:transcriptional regulator [Rhizobium sp. RU36D]|uniref:HVO_A0114 family putative DNA-binding protein n=1 Tax=Rhizobium sp. RU36D TaxID=1907415 RepID=UPI0009D8A20C|nr:transcriptional regulator [Rhizobium sp. RU36D]SMD19167.1 Predicted transcriptional regulator [Rhizobium sp. RU36D]
MATLKVKIESLEETMAAFADAFRVTDLQDDQVGEYSLSFPSWDLMHKVLAPKRLDIVKAMAGQGPLSIREVARRVNRDFKGVHADVDKLLKSGVIDRAERGGVIFPYDRIHFEFDIDAAA